MLANAMFTAPMTNRIAASQNCQPRPPLVAARTAAMNRKARPEAERRQSVGMDADRIQDTRHRERRDERAAIERRRATVDRPFDEERDPDRQSEDRAGVLELRKRLLQKEQTTEHEQEDADPRQARPAGCIGPPLPAVDPHVVVARRSAAAVGAETGHRLKSIVVVHRNLRYGCPRSISQAARGRCHDGATGAQRRSRPARPGRTVRRSAVGARHSSRGRPARHRQRLPPDAAAGQGAQERQRRATRRRRREAAAS